MQKFVIAIALIFSSFQLAFAQFQTVKSSHYLLGVDVEGYQIDLPFSKDKSKEAWKAYAKGFGKSEATNSHQSYQTTFATSVYEKEVLIFSI